MELDSNGVSIEQPIIQQDNYESYFRDECHSSALPAELYPQIFSYSIGLFVPVKLTVFIISSYFNFFNYY